MRDRLRIGLLCAHNPYDRRAFSGTAFYMRQALQARADIDLTVLGRHPKTWIGVAGRLRRYLRRPPRHGWERIDGSGLDAIVAPVSSGLVALHGERIVAPIVLVTDATPGFLRTFYGYPVPPEADAQERRALSLSACTVYSSQYMADLAAREFAGIDPGKLHAIPFGLNLDTIPDAPPQKPPFAPVRLLFIAKEWERKGGDVAVAALGYLLAKGVSAQLTVIGSSSAEARAHPQVEVIPYLDKNDPKDARTLTDRLARAHVFLLPTRADCTPMVIAEANAHGCPVLVTRTGGIGSLMEDGRNGEMMPPGSDGAAYGAKIEQIVADPGTYGDLVESSFAHCRERLTWSAWSDGILDIVRTGLRGDRKA